MLEFQRHNHTIAIASVLEEVVKKHEESQKVPCCTVKESKKLPLYGFEHMNMISLQNVKIETVEKYSRALNNQMINTPLNRSMAQLRHINPEMYKIINKLWKQEIGRHNLFKLRFVLTYVVMYLEEYLTLCEKRFKQMEEYDANQGADDNVFVNQL